MGNSSSSEPDPFTSSTYTNTLEYHLLDFEESAENRKALREPVKSSIIDLIEGGYSCTDQAAGEIMAQRLRNDSAVVDTIVDRLYAKRRAVRRNLSREEIREVMGACILEYMEKVEEEISNQRALKGSCRGNASARAAIAEEAKRLRNDCRMEYAHNVAKTSIYKDANDKRMHFFVGDPKCNLFVFDVLNGAGVTAPLNWSGKWPFTAADWYGTAHSYFDTLDSSTAMQPGDIVSTAKHCGIAVDSTYVIAAGEHKVTLDTRVKQSLKEGRIRRYNQS